MKKWKLGNQKFRDGSSTVVGFDATHRIHRYSIGGDWDEYDIIKLSVPVSFLRDNSAIQVYDAEADELMEMYKQRLNVATLDEIASARGHLHVPPLLVNILDEMFYRVQLLPGRVPSYLDSHCRVLFPADAVEPLMRTFDGGGRTSWLSALGDESHEVVDIVLSNMPTPLELIQMSTINTHATPMAKSQATKIEADFVKTEEGKKTIEHGGLGMSKQSRAVILERGRASDVVKHIRACGPEMPLYQMVKATNDGKYVTIADNKTHRTKPKPPYVCRTIDDGVLEVLQNGLEGRKSDNKTELFAPPGWWSDGVLAVDESAMYIQNIFRATYSVWPQVKRAWEDNEVSYVLTENKGVKTMLSFAWQVLKRVDELVEYRAGARLGVSFWTEMFDMMAPHLPIVEVPGIPLVDTNHVEFWSKQSLRWRGKGSNTTAVGPVVEEMKAAFGFVGGFVEAILQTSDVQIIARRNGVKLSENLKSTAT